MPRHDRAPRSGNRKPADATSKLWGQTFSRLFKAMIPRIPRENMLGAYAMTCILAIMVGYIVIVQTASMNTTHALALVAFGALVVIISALNRPSSFLNARRKANMLRNQGKESRTRPEPRAPKDKSDANPGEFPNDATEAARGGRL